MLLGRNVRARLGLAVWSILLSSSSSRGGPPAVCPRNELSLRALLSPAAPKQRLESQLASHFMNTSYCDGKCHRLTKPCSFSGSFFIIIS